MRIRAALFFVGITIVLAISSVYSQETVSLGWMKQLGGTGGDRSRDMVLDASGNVYTTGFYSNTVDFDPGSGTFNLTSTGGSQIFVSKLDVDGNFVWAKSMGGSGGDTGQGIAVDAVGNVYITGGFTGTADFDPGPGSFTLTAATTAEYDIYIVKLDINGDFVWAKGITGGTWWDNGNDIAVDAAGNVHVVGRFYYQGGARDFDPGPGTFFLTAGQEDVFILKLDTNGNFVWARDFGAGSLENRGYSILLDATGNVYTTGYFEGTIDFDPGAGIANLTAQGDWDIFYSKLDANGNFVWARSMVNSIANYYSIGDHGSKIALDAAGNLYATGRYSGTVDFDMGAGTFNLTASGGGYDIYLTKLNTNGDFVWAKSMGGTGYDEGFSIAVDDTGNKVYLAGLFVQTVDFDPGAGTFNLTSLGGDDVFFSKFDGSGNFVWATSMGSTSGDQGYYIAPNSSGDLNVVGYFQGTIDFDPSACVLNLTSLGGQDIFIGKLEETSVIPPPTISEFLPLSGPIGSTITITGTNFSTIPANNTVLFNTTPAIVIASTNTSITITVPAGATTGPIAVTVECLTATSTQFFCIPSSPTSLIGLIAYYPFTGNANDASGNNNNGTVNGATLTTDRFGAANSAYLFNGTSSYISIPNSASLQSPTTRLTMNAWINLTGYSLVGQSGIGPILTKSNSTSASFMYNFSVNNTPSGVYASINTFTNFSGAASNFCLNQWYMLTAVLDNTTAYFYVNGSLIGTQTFTTNIVSDALGLEIGRDRPGLTEIFNGKIDDIHIYNRALSECEVAGLYTPASPPPTISSFTPVSGPVGAPVTITGTNFDPTPANNAVSFNGTAAVVTASTATSITTTVPAGATTGKISVTVNCLTVLSALDFTVTAAPIITINPQPSASAVCNGIISTFNTAASGTTNINYQWQFSTTLAGTYNDITNGNGYSNVATASLSVNTTGNFGAGFYRCQVSGDFAATVFSNAAELIVNDIPSIPTMGTVNLGCAPASTTLNPTGAFTGEEYKFFDAATGGNVLSSGLSFTTPSLSISTTYYVCTYNTTTLCESARAPVVITIQTCNAPTVETSITTAFIEGIVTVDLEELISDADNNLDPSTLQIITQPLSGASALISGFLLTIDYSGIPFPGTDNVVIGICDLTGICVQQELIIKLEGEIEIFNAISPNNDGKNDILTIQYIDILPEAKNNKVTIFDRWGNVVWEGTNYDNTSVVFSGFHKNGKELLTGTYFYKIDFNGSLGSKTGYISLKR